MTDATDIWQSRYYFVLKLYLSRVGIWPYQSFRDRCVRFVLFFTISLSMLIPQFLYFVNDSITLNDVFDCIPSMSISLLFSLKLFIIMLYKDKIKLCFNGIKQDWLSLNTDAERIRLQQQSEYGRRITKFYGVGFHIIGCLFVLKPIMATLTNADALNITKSSISSASKLPFLVDYGPTVDQYFYLIAIHCYATIYVHVVVVITTDSLYCTLIQHACGMFAIIGYMLENIGTNNDVTIDSNPKKFKDANYYTVLNCLRKHLHTIEFAERIETIYTTIFLVNITSNILAGSLVGIQLLIKLNNSESSEDIVAPLTVYLGQFLHIFIPFWQAQFLLDYSILPYTSVCRANWYYTSKRCQRLLLLIMMRTMSPCKITAGKIMTLSMETFGAALKASLSYLTLFRSLQ